MSPERLRKISLYLKYIAFVIDEELKPRRPKVKLTPVADNVFIIPDAAPTESKGGIALPQSAQKSEGLLRGRVTAVGPGLTLSSGVVVPPQVNEGDHVLYEGARAIVEFDEVHYHVLKDSDIAAVLS